MGLRPMLAESISLDALPKYMTDPAWVCQVKADGQRLLVHVQDGKVTALGRSGQNKVTGLLPAMLDAFRTFTTSIWTFDGELIGSQLVLFDIVHAGRYCNPDTPFAERYRVLSALYTDVWSPDSNLIGLLDTAENETDKLALVKAAEDNKREGIMLRHVDGRYKSGGRSTHLLKCKFVKESDCIVLDVGQDGKDNVTLGLLDPANNRVVEVGRASAIGKRPKPQKLDVWETKYLYVLDPGNPRLYQPRLVRKRTDKALHECLIDQLDGHFTNKSLTAKVREDM